LWVWGCRGSAHGHTVITRLLPLHSPLLLLLPPAVVKLRLTYALKLLPGGGPPVDVVEQCDVRGFPPGV
jgi:hypothetical protein